MEHLILHVLKLFLQLSVCAVQCSKALLPENRKVLIVWWSLIPPAEKNHHRKTQTPGCCSKDNASAHGIPALPTELMGTPQIQFLNTSLKVWERTIYLHATEACSNLIGQLFQPKTENKMLTTSKTCALPKCFAFIYRYLLVEMNSLSM